MVGLHLAPKMWVVLVGMMLSLQKSILRGTGYGQNPWVVLPGILEEG